MNLVKNRLADVIADATAAGLVVSGSTIQEPVKDDSDAGYTTKKATYDTLDSTLSVIRADESAAHDTLIAACDSLKSAGEWFRDKYLPTGTVADFSKAAGWATGCLLGLGGVRSDLSPGSSRATRRGIQVPGGSCRAADRSKMGLLRTLWAKTKPENWINKPYTRGTTAWKRSRP